MDIRVRKCADDDVQLTELVERIVARLSGSPKAMSIFLEVEAEMRRTELGAGERLLANANAWWNWSRFCWSVAARRYY